MNIFNFFKKKGGAEESLRAILPVAESTDLQENSMSNYATRGNAVSYENNKPLTVSYATGWPIDIIYGYLHKNYEQKGFEDAMLKCDLTFRDMNKSVIRNKILMVFREINLNYDVMRQDVQNRIDNCSAVGLLTTVSQLEKQALLIDSHKEELRRLEDDFRRNANESSIPLQSYECGFLRGIATIALGRTKGNGIASMRPDTMGENCKIAIA